MTTQTPLPCPYCGGAPEAAKELRDGYADCKDDPDAYAHFFRCVSCAAQGGWSKNEVGAVRLWNMRCPPDFDVVAIRIVKTLEAFHAIPHRFPDDFNQVMKDDVAEMDRRYAELFNKVNYLQTMRTVEAEFINRIMFGLR